MPYGLLIEKTGYFPYYTENIIPNDLTENKLERNVVIPDDLKNDFSLYYPASDTILGEKSRALMIQLSGLMKKQTGLTAWFDPQGDSLDFLRINGITSAFVQTGIAASRLRAGARPDTGETFIRIEINTGAENAVLMEPAGTALPGEESWTIQFAASKTPLAKKTFKELDPVYEFKGKDGFYRYSYGNFKSQEEANRKLQTVKKKGFSKPFSKSVGSIKKL